MDTRSEEKQRLFSPTLFVGLGGSGSTVVDLIAAKMRRHPSWHDFRDLIHFIAIDTNKADLDKLHHLPRENRFLVSAFDRRAYVARKRGKQELPADPMVTQWVHPNYQFRETQAAGAGQVRLESRLGLYFSLEEDRARIIRSIQGMLDAATRPDNPFRDSENRVVNTLVYGSVAGGTGSGAFLPMAYLLQDLIKDRGWGRPNIVGTLMLPSVFTADVQNALQADIDANGYAALKELEHLTKLSYEGHKPDQIEFHYDPNRPERSRVTTRPFSICYLVDKPAELSVEHYKNALADSTFLQVVSPIIGAQIGEYDNIEKRQKTLALGNFAVHYGSFGAAILILPRADIVEYSVLRWVHRVLDTYLVFGRDEAFRVRYDDPKFQRLAPEEKEKEVDNKFLEFVDHSARLEEDRQEKGIYSQIVGQKATDGGALREAFRRKLAALFDGLDGQIEIQAFDPTQIHEGNQSLGKSQDNLRTDVAGSRGRVMGSYLSSALADVKSGRFLNEFFGNNKAGPLVQRYFLVKLKNEGPLVPFEEAEDGNYLLTTKDNAYNLDAENVKQELANLEKRLRETSERGILGKAFARENKAFEAARRKVQEQFQVLENGNRDYLKASFWQAFHAELQGAIAVRLTAFRNVSQIADETARNVMGEAERLRADPATRGEASDAASFYLDSEVLRDDREGQRLWNRFFAHRLDKGAHYDEAKIFEAITESFQPATDKEGRPRAKDAMGIVRDLRARLEELARGTITRVLEEQGFDLKSALELEARYVATRGAAAADEDVLDKVQGLRIQEHIRDKFKRLVEQCVILASVDPTKRDDPTVTPADIFYTGMAKRYQSDDAGSLKTAIRDVAPGVKVLDEWYENENDIIVFYRAMLGIPLYFYRRVNDDLYHNYRAIRALPGRTYPLHIESGWEDALPNIEPKEVQEAEEKRQAAEKAQEQRAEKEQRIWAFVLATLAGSVQKNSEGGWDWVLGAVRKKLGNDRGLAYSAFWALDSSLLSDLVNAGKRFHAEKTASAPLSRAFRDELGSYLRGVSEQLAMAVAFEEEAAKNYLKEEKKVVEEQIAALPAK